MEGTQHTIIQTLAAPHKRNLIRKTLDFVFVAGYFYINHSTKRTLGLPRNCLERFATSWLTNPVVNI